MPGLSQNGGLTLVHVTQRTVTPVPLYPLFYTDENEYYQMRGINNELNARTVNSKLDVLKMLHGP